jgi:3-oxoacyl-[acyl-carrier-protein] synthase II
VLDRRVGSDEFEMTERVVITGAGAVTPLGLNARQFWNGLVEGRSGIGPITKFDPSDLGTRFAGELKGFDPAAYLDRKEAKRADPFTQYALAAAKEAVEQSGLETGNENGDRLGAIIGSGIGGTTTWEAQHRILIEKGPSRVSPFFVPMMIADMASGQISMMFGARGANFATVSACASGAHAIGEAFRMIRYGELDAALAGGSEAPVTPLAMAGFCSMRALSTRNEDPAAASRPFERDRDGFVMSEGAAVFVLESETYARRRGAQILAELAGYGATADAHHITAPAPGGEGAARAMQLALESAGLRAADVDYINAHGTSTPLNDKYETMAIHTVFGDHARKLMVSSTKSMTGHLLGAAGAVELLSVVFSLRNDIVPPTINYEVPDPECDLDYVPNETRRAPVHVALSNSLGFGGHNVALAVRKYGAEA